VAGEGSCPRFGGFCGCSASLGLGPWRWFGLVRLGRRGGDEGWGELPGSPGGSPPRFPALSSQRVSSSLRVDGLVRPRQRGVRSRGGGGLPPVTVQVRAHDLGDP
jgi:hypothetical protein